MPHEKGDKRQSIWKFKVYNKQRQKLEAGFRKSNSSQNCFLVNMEVIAKENAVYYIQLQCMDNQLWSQVTVLKNVGPTKCTGIRVGPNICRVCLCGSNEVLGLSTSEVFGSLECVRCSVITLPRETERMCDIVYACYYKNTQQFSGSRKRRLLLVTSRFVELRWFP